MSAQSMHAMTRAHSRPQVRPFAEKLARFGIVGLANGILYAAVTSVCVDFLGLSAMAASAVGYLAAVPFAFLAHRSFTFASEGRFWVQAGRFVLVHGTSLVVSVGAMAAAVHLLGMHYGVGIVAALLLVPAVTFVVFDLWVFAPARGHRSIPATDDGPG